MIFEFDIDFLEETIWVAINEPPEIVKKNFPKCDASKGSEYGYQGLYVRHEHTDKTTKSCIYLHKFHQRVLVHESNHAVYFICDIAGIDDAETQAYLQDYIFDKITKMYREIKKKGTKNESI